MSIEKLRKFNIEEKMSISEQDEKDFDEVLVSDSSIIVIKRYEDKNCLEENWKETVHFTAGYIQNNLQKIGFDEVFAWDIYIFFLTNFNVDSNLMNDIEKDKYCCKKYVINTSDYTDENSAITSRIPLFASLRDTTIGRQTSFNDTYMKEKLTEGNNSIIAQEFRRIDFIDNDFMCDQLIDKLKELYINEKNKKN